MAKQGESQAGTINAALSGDNIAVFGGNFIFNQYPSGQPPALILKLYQLLGPARINTKLWHTSREYDNYRKPVSTRIKAQLDNIIHQKPTGAIVWEIHTHFYHPLRADAYRATVVNIAQGLSDNGSLLGTILIPERPRLSDPYHIITTLAFQIALNIPGVAEHIVEAIDCVPWIHELNATIQIATLITVPLMRATESGPKSDDWKWIVVDEGQLHFSDGLLHRQIITELSNAITAKKMGINIGFLLTGSEGPPGF